MYGDQVVVGQQLVVDQQHELLFDRRRQSYVIKKPDWERLKSSVVHLPERTSTFSSAGWACLGIAGSFIAAALTLPVSAATLESWVLPACWIGGAAAAVLGILCLVMQRHHDEFRGTTKGFCIELFDAIESGFVSISTQPSLEAKRTAEPEISVIKPPKPGVGMAIQKDSNTLESEVFARRNRDDLSMDSVTTISDRVVPGLLDAMSENISRSVLVLQRYKRSQ